MRIKRILFAGLVCTVAVSAGSARYAHAEDAAIHSVGSIVLRDGDEAAIYAEDIQYLQDELNKLFSELP